MADPTKVRLMVLRVFSPWLTLLVFGMVPSLAAQDQIILYARTTFSSFSIQVDGLTIFWSDFGYGDHQFNLTTWLDTEPQTVTVKVRVGKKESSICSVEVRRFLAGNPTRGTVLAEKTIRGSKMEKKKNKSVTVISLDIARQVGNVRPLWADHSQVDLLAVTRKKSVDLVKEVFEALQKCDFDSLMALIDSALTNQALMSGVDPELLKQITLTRLQKSCVPGISVAETMDAYYKTTNQDVMAPLNFKKMTYKFTRDESREDKRGNLYTPKEDIEFKTSDQQKFSVRVYLSYTDDKRNRRFISRFVFQQK